VWAEAFGPVAWLAPRALSFGPSGYEFHTAIHRVYHSGLPVKGEGRIFFVAKLRVHDKPGGIGIDTGHGLQQPADFLGVGGFPQGWQDQTHNS